MAEGSRRQGERLNETQIGTNGTNGTNGNEQTT